NPEHCNGRDDDCDGIIDEAIDDCALEHASASCVSGHCVIMTCDPGYSDCDNRVDTGCEYAESDASCLACGKACDAMDSGATTPDAADITTRSHDAGPKPHVDAETPPPPPPPPHDEDSGVICSSQPEQCDGLDNDCDDKIDEEGVCDSCMTMHVSGQSPDCDRCLCTRCAPQVDTCIGNPDWNERCVAILQCYGTNNLAGKCPSGDCYGGGGGPCASVVFNAGPSCTIEPPNSGCSAATFVRTKCLLTTCASVCKF
ncbi:MAG TPA: hypothetical protein VHZ95_06995, partial [Polyangiales bacterium]|nr:hypothetical protein [Polyangiales bacterium]